MEDEDVITGELEIFLDPDPPPSTAGAWWIALGTAAAAWWLWRRA